MGIYLYPILGMLFSLFLIFGREQVWLRLEQKRLEAGEAPKPRNPHWDRLTKIVGMFGFAIFLVYFFFLVSISR